MAKESKVRFGIKKVHYALWDDTNETYGELVAFPGAVSWSQTREGGDSSDFYADDGVYYTFAGTNGGYSADLEMAFLPDSVRRDLLGEIVDDTTGVQFEVTDAEPKQFAILFETSGDSATTGFVFYNCKASRPEMNANTKTDSPDVDTTTLNIRIASQDFKLGNDTHSFVQGHIDKIDANVSKYAAFFDAVSIPTASGGSGDSGSTVVSA